MNEVKKTHIIYAIISICAVCAYGGFLIRNSIEEVDIVEETVPYNYEEEFYIAPQATEPTQKEVAAPVIVIEDKVEERETETEKETEKVTEAAPLRGFSPILPVEGTVVKSFSEKHIYNERTKDWRSHTGIDISANVTEKVVSCEDGAVIACYTDPLWGNVIEIDHGEYVSVYKNVSTLIMVKEGDSVKRGQVISGVGETSTTEGYQTPHIHFELLYYGEYTDPAALIG